MRVLRRVVMVGSDPSVWPANLALSSRDLRRRHPRVTSPKLEPLAIPGPPPLDEPRRRPLALLLLIVLLALVSFVGIAVTVGRGIPEDTALLQWLHGHSTPTIDAMFAWATYAGGLIVIAPAALALVVALARRGCVQDAWFLLLSVSGSELLNTALKVAFGRRRPAASWASDAAGYSFPSGHAMSSLVFLGALTALAWRSRWRWLVAAISAFVTVLVGASRLALGVHYPSDVVAGWCAGTVWLCALMLLRTPQRNHLRRLVTSGLSRK